MGRKVTLATCTLNQWALDFEGNYNRILLSIKKAKELGAKYRSGPELEICGYSCQDHFYESDTYLHSWEILAELLVHPICSNLLIDVGMPVMHKNVTYNCRVVFLNRKVLLIRPKLILCDDGNYRETRWFTAWTKLKETEDYFLPRMISAITDQKVVPIGDAVISTRDTCIGIEICEELWNVASSHIDMSLDGVEIIVNGSGSEFMLRKAYYAVDLVKSASAKCGGCYMYGNLRGCDGERVYFGGWSCIALNGQILSKADEFGLQEVEVISSTIDLEDIRSYRNTNRSRNLKAASVVSYPRIQIEFSLSGNDDFSVPLSKPISYQYLSAEEEIAMGPACWIWDYLRRSAQGGFFLPLSGGVDSASTACIVSSMCHMIVGSIEKGDKIVLEDVRRIVGDPEYKPRDHRELCNRLFVTCYMGSENSSEETKARAKQLAHEIGSYHMTTCIDMAVKAILGIFSTTTGLIPKFKAQGGSLRENLALQNIQARIRMVISYLFAQLMLWVRSRPGGLLVLGSANVDESLRGYLTKYDCSSADINPIGGICKKDLKSFLKYIRNKYGYTAIDSIISAPPTAELEPLKSGVIVQTDEQDMGMSYDQLNLFGRLRKQNNCAPYSMFCKSIHLWEGNGTPEEIAEKVKHFFRTYAINRHKMTVLTPGFFAESYSCDDNRFDHRPFLYNPKWSWQFGSIDRQLQRLKDKPQHQAAEPVQDNHLSHSSNSIISKDSNIFGGSRIGIRVNSIPQFSYYSTTAKVLPSSSSPQLFML